MFSVFAACCLDSVEGEAFRADELEIVVEFTGGLASRRVS